MSDIPQDIRDFVDQLFCRGCGTPAGHGLAIRIHPEGGANFAIAVKCLRCGRSGYVRVVSSLVEVPAAATAVYGSDISSDEVIDLHEALKSDDWLAQLTKQQ